MPDRPLAFVIMPFSPEFQSIFDQLIRPALEDSGYEVTRADSFLDQQNILKDIVHGISRAALVVADLTTLNSNVLYELGLSHGLNKPTIMITQSLDEVPFDLRGYRIQTYDIAFDRVQKLKTSLAKIASEHLQGAITFSNPVTDFSGSAPSNRQVIKASQVSSATEPSLAEEMGILDHLVQGEKAATEFSNLLAQVTKDTADTGDRMKRHTENVRNITENKGPGSAVLAARVGGQVATDLQDAASRLEEVVPKLEQALALLEESYTAYVTWFSPTSDDQASTLTTFRDSAVGLRDSTSESLSGITCYRESIEGLHGISRDVNRASRRLATAIGSIVSVTQKTNAFASRLITLIDDKIAGFAG